jgi:hypothetical protein
MVNNPYLDLVKSSFPAGLIPIIPIFIHRLFCGEIHRHLRRQFGIFLLAIAAIFGGEPWGTMAFGFTSTQPWLSHSKQKFNGLPFQNFTKRCVWKWDIDGLWQDRHLSIVPLQRLFHIEFGYLIP